MDRLAPNINKFSVSDLSELSDNFSITSQLAARDNLDSRYNMSQNHNRTNNPNNPRNPLKYEVRTVQKSVRSLVLTLPKIYCEILGIEQFDLIKMQLLKDKQQILLEKIDLDHSTFTPRSNSGSDFQ